MAEHELSKELHDVKGDLQQLRADFASLAETFKAEAHKRASTAASDVKSRVGDGVDFLKENLGAARELGEKALKQAQAKVEENPMTSVLIAFGVGFLIGKFTHRR